MPRAALNPALALVSACGQESANRMEKTGKKLAEESLAHFAPVIF
jgi:hypothetical protein